MSDETKSNNWLEAGETGFGAFGLVIMIVALAGACLMGLSLMDGIEGSRADRAQARAAAEEAQAYARSTEARAEVDKVAVRADAALALQVEQHEHELEVLRQESEDFQERVVLLAIAIKNLDRVEYNRLAAQLDTKGAHAPWWWSAISAAVAILVFVAALLIMRLRGGRVYYE